MSNKPEEIKINGEFIRLDSLLKFAAVTGTGGEAKYLIQGGMVELNGEVCLQRTKKIRAGDIVSVNGESFLISGEEK